MTDLNKKMQPIGVPRTNLPPQTASVKKLTVGQQTTQPRTGPPSATKQAQYSVKPSLSPYR
jgi:hypothetical protein